MSGLEEKRFGQGHKICVPETFNDGGREKRGRGTPIDGDHIKIMNGHIIASWQSGDVSQRYI